MTLAEKAQVRLHRRFKHLIDNKKPPTKVNVAVARELSGFIWAALRENARRTTKAA